MPKSRPPSPVVNKPRSPKRASADLPAPNPTARRRGRPPKTPRPIDAPSSPDLILEAAERLILTRGFGGTSIDMILEACGVTKGMFFYYFKNKLDLGLALAKRTRAIEQEAITRLSETAIDHTEDPLEQVLFILEHLKRRYPVRQGQQPYGSLLTVFVYEPDLFSAETDAVIRSMVRDWKDTFVSRFRQLEVGGRVKARPPAESVANHLVAMLEGGQVLARITQRPRVIQEQLDHCQRYLQLLYRQ